MFNKIFYFIKRSKNRGKCTLKQEKGFSLVEVIVAIVIISIITVVLINGTIMAVNVSKMNRAKTLSSAVASEKLELIKCMDYEDIVITGVPLTPEWDDWLSGHTELEETGYIINYEVTWVDGVPDSYKQLSITVIKDPMNTPVEVITQIYPTAAVESIIDYPPPVNLYIDYDIGSGSKREVKLEWTAPDTENVIDRYNVYRNGNYLGRSLTEIYIDYPGNNKTYTYYTTVLYKDGTESVKSNEATTK